MATLSGGMEIWQYLSHCPRCGHAAAAPPPPAKRPADHHGAAHEGWPPPFRCGQCHWIQYFNPICAVGVFIERLDGRVLFIRRGREPGLGKLAPPGGFIDIGETAEEAAHREIREEVGLSIDSLHYLGSWPNRYPNRDYIVNVLDFFFHAKATSDLVVAQEGEVAAHEWLDPLQVMAEDLAFTSMQAAHRAFQAWLGQKG
jgi:NAD+ diphosphatase